jgi:hypothetical protein
MTNLSSWCSVGAGIGFYSSFHADAESDDIEPPDQSPKESIMSIKSTLAVAALSLVAAASAFAAEGTQDFENRTLSSKSRAEVVAELRSAGAPNVNTAWPTQAPQSTLTRARVVAETREAQRLGLTDSGEVLKLATPAQAEAINLAGERAVSETLAARR